MDSRQRAWYPWGTAAPGQVPKEWLASGYMVQAGSIDELTQKTGIDPAGLHRTLGRFNEFCRTGVDSDFGRGSRAFDRCHGDPSHDVAPRRLEPAGDHLPGGSQAC